MGRGYQAKGRLATGEVTSAAIADGAIVNADVNAAAEVAVSKLADGTARQLLQTDAVGTDVEWTSDISVGDVTTNGAPLNTPELIIEVVEGATDCAVGDGKAYFTIPANLNGKNITAVHISRSSANGTTGTMTAMLHNLTNAANVLSTGVSMDTGEPDSSTAATPYVIDLAEDDVATNDIMRVDIDAVHTTPAKGLVLRIQFTL